MKLFQEGKLKFFARKLCITFPLPNIKAKKHSKTFMPRNAGAAKLLRCNKFSHGSIAEFLLIPAACAFIEMILSKIFFCKQKGARDFYFCERVFPSIPQMRPLFALNYFFSQTKIGKMSPIYKSTIEANKSDWGGMKQ